jgi:Domain of unknown function (DUF4440)
VTARIPAWPCDRLAAIEANRWSCLSWMPAGLTDGLGWIKHLVLIMDNRATSKKMAYCRDQGTAMPKSTEDAVAAVAQRRIDALIPSDINVRDEMIEEPCIHVASNGTARTKAVFREQVATLEVSFDLFEIDENHIRTFGEAAVVAGTYRDIVRMRGKPNPLKQARHLRVYMNRGGSWKLVAPQATQIAPRSTCGMPPS